MAPRRTKRQRRSSTGDAEVEHEPIDEQAGSPETERVQQVQPGGQPFTNVEVTWAYERIKLLHREKKVVMTGYETLAGEINEVLKTLADKSVPTKVTKSALGSYLRLPDYNTKSGCMIHHVVCHQVIPTPNFDPTSLFFLIGEKVIRFSRVEYALVSGLKFGPATFNPYARHEVPQNSMFQRLFGGNEETTTADVKTAFINKQFQVKKKKAKASDDDYIRLAKLLVACGFIMGFTARKKIPKWMWVLIEDEGAWEDFPWGSISYQVLMKTVNGVTKLERGSKVVTYQFKGNTITFSAWIFEALPKFEEVVGRRKTIRERPRFMRYLYVKERGYPTDEQIMENVVQMLKPHKKEGEKMYWKSLENDPEGTPFALEYDANESKRKRPRDEEDGEDENQVHGQPRNSSTAAPTLAQIEEILVKYHAKFVDEVANKVVALILQKAPDATDTGGDHLQPTELNDHLAAEDDDMQMNTTEGGGHEVCDDIEQHLEAAVQEPTRSSSSPKPVEETPADTAAQGAGSSGAGATAASPTTEASTGQGGAKETVDVEVGGQV